MDTYKIPLIIETDYSGYKNLTSFYHEFSNSKNMHINLDFSKCEWFDANMCALLHAIMHKLTAENRLTFETDYEYANKNLNVFIRNGFLTDGNIHVDERRTTVPCRSLDTREGDFFLDYLEILMNHRGMPKAIMNIKNQITSHLFEFFTNTHIHANTQYPVFTAGQYYPTKKLLKFSLVDLGDGFLPKIKSVTSGEIDTHNKAIKWALAGNTSKDDGRGGSGISGVHDFCKKNDFVSFDIISGNWFWSSSHKGTMFEEGRQLHKPFVGTMINLCFKKI